MRRFHPSATPWIIISLLVLLLLTYGEYTSSPQTVTGLYLGVVLLIAIAISMIIIRMARAHSIVGLDSSYLYLPDYSKKLGLAGMFRDNLDIEVPIDEIRLVVVGHRTQIEKAELASIDEGQRSRIRALAQSIPVGAGKPSGGLLLASTSSSGSHSTMSTLSGAVVGASTAVLQGESLTTGAVVGAAAAATVGASVVGFVMILRKNNDLYWFSIEAFAGSSLRAFIKSVQGHQVPVDDLIGTGKFL